MYYKIPRVLLKAVNKPFFTNFLHNYVYKMDKAYFRHLNGTDQFQMTFYYVNKSLKVNRQFNFCRQLTETVPTFLTRVNANVEKIVNKKKKKKKDDNVESTSVDVNAKILLNNENLTDEDLLCQDIFKKENNVVLEIFENQYQVIINSPWVETIALPSSILATFPVYPSKLETFYMEPSKSDFKWYRSSDKKNWTEIGNGYVYFPTNEDVNCYLKLICTPKNMDYEGPAVETISDVKVDASPGYCPFETRQQFTKTPTLDTEFRVVSYNILADLYCDSDYTRTVLHPYCPPYALAIDYRKQLIVKELLGYNADIICLQEVDKKLYNHDFLPLFASLNYDSIFTQKGGEVAEGLTCVYNKKKFKLIQSDGTVIAEELENNAIFADMFGKISLNEKLTKRILERKNAIQTVVLECLSNNKLLFIANTHLYFHPDADHIRLLQGGISIMYVKHKIEELKKEYPDREISLIFCGDFNSVPECGIYKLFTTGQILQDCIDFQSNKYEAVDNISFEQPFKLASGCGTPKYTNFTSGFQDCLDYIFYDTNTLSVSQVIPLPTDEELTANTALPSIVFPSDHISLICDLKWL